MERNFRGESDLAYHVFDDKVSVIATFKREDLLRFLLRAGAPLLVWGSESDPNKEVDKVNLPGETPPV